MMRAPFTLVRGALLIGLLATPALGQGTSAAVPAEGLSTFGWAFMLLSNLFVWWLTLRCFKRVLQSPTVTPTGPAGTP